MAQPAIDNSDMNITKQEIQKIRIENARSLDPIDVYLEDVGAGQGKITMTCYGESWCAYWGGMGERNIAQFFCSCDEHYIANRMSAISSSMVDIDKIRDDAREIDPLLAYEVPDVINSNDSDLIVKIYGGNMWDISLPEKPNPKYQYLCKIILAVQAALKQLELDK